MSRSRGPVRLPEPGRTPDAAAVVVATGDDAMADAAARWCAALGVPARRIREVAGLRRQWRSDDVVVVGWDLATDLRADGGTGRRDGVLLLGPDGTVHLDVVMALGAVAVLDPRDDVASVAALAEALDGGRDGCLVVVVGAVGGAGSSTMAACLALAAARRGLSVALLDDDPWSGGLDLLLGAEDVPGARWDDLDPGGGPWGSRALREALPRQDGVAVLAWARGDRQDRRGPAPAGPAPVGPAPTGPGPSDLAAACLAARRGHDLVVVDLPRHRLDRRERVVADAVACLLLVPDDVVSVAAARRLLPGLTTVTSTLLVASVDRPGGSGPAVVADLLGRPVLGRLRSSRHVRSAVDAGRGPGSWRAARSLGGELLDLLGLGDPASGQELR